jgi:hypothetical protein
VYIVCKLGCQHDYLLSGAFPRAPNPGFSLFLKPTDSSRFGALSKDVTDGEGLFVRTGACGEVVVGCGGA